jgi:hypothetical protein
MSNSVRVQVGRQEDGWRCEVEVTSAVGTTRHTVQVSTEDAARWARGGTDADVGDLVRRSFDFLLEREPPSSILPRFDLSVIQRYFPEYDQQFKS